MSKSKKERQQDKKEQRQMQVKDRPAVKATEEKNVIVEAKKEDAVENGEIKMNFYSAMSMITTLVTAAAAVISMIIAARGFYYILQTIYDETQTDILFLNDKLLEIKYNPSIRAFLYIMGFLLVVQVILSLAGTVTAINPNKKPLLSVSSVMIVLAAATLVLYVFNYTKTADITTFFSRVESHKQTGLYTMYLYVLILNLICAVLNLAGQQYGLKLYKKTGRTC